jgi:hypothetical protein
MSDDPRTLFRELVDTIRFYLCPHEPEGGRHTDLVKRADAFLKDHPPDEPDEAEAEKVADTNTTSEDEEA